MPAKQVPMCPMTHCTHVYLWDWCADAYRRTRGQPLKTKSRTDPGTISDLLQTHQTMRLGVEDKWFDQGVPLEEATHYRCVECNTLVAITVSHSEWGAVSLVHETWLGIDWEDFSYPPEPHILRLVRRIQRRHQ